MRAAGCDRVFFEVESGGDDDSVLRSIGFAVSLPLAADFSEAKMKAGLAKAGLAKAWIEYRLRGKVDSSPSPLFRLFERASDRILRRLRWR
jgi:hypothetical protein